MNKRGFLKRAGWVSTGLIFVPKLIRAQYMPPTHLLGNPPAPTGGSPPLTLLDGLLASWSLDESSGTSAADASGNGHTGTLVNSPAWVPGIVNNGLQFTSAGSKDMTVGDIGLSGLTAATMLLWFKRSAANSVVIMGDSGDFSTASFCCFTQTDGFFYVLNCNGSPAAATFATNDTGWHTVVIIFDGSLTGNSNRLKIYFDGSLAALGYSGTMPASLVGGQTGFGIGGAISNGTVDIPCVWNRALDAADVFTLHNFGSGKQYPFT